MWPPTSSEMTALGLCVPSISDSDGMLPQKLNDADNYLQ